MQLDEIIYTASKKHQIGLNATKSTLVHAGRWYIVPFHYFFLLRVSRTVGWPDFAWHLIFYEIRLMMKFEILISEKRELLATFVSAQHTETLWYAAFPSLFSLPDVSIFSFLRNVPWENGRFCVHRSMHVDGFWIRSLRRLAPPTVYTNQEYQGLKTCYWSRHAEWSEMSTKEDTEVWLQISERCFSEWFSANGKQRKTN